MRKIEPSVQTMLFNTDVIEVGGTGTFYIDLSQAASILNRRFYRQGLNWAVAGFKILTQNPFSISIRKAHDTWVTSGSWEKTMRHWLKQQNEAIAEAGAESAVVDLEITKYILTMSTLRLEQQTHLMQICFLLEEMDYHFQLANGNHRK